MASIGRLLVKDSVLLLCDMQEKFRPNIVHFTNILSNAARVLQACRILGIPPILTEQYPRGLGPTVPELGASDLKPHEKTQFSMLTEGVEKELKALGGPKKAILCGIEAQACIACTTYDLLERGMEVHVVADAVSSRSQTDRLFALSRLRQSGAYLTTTEAVLLQLVQDAKHPNFKEIQKLLAHPSPDTGLLSFFSSVFQVSKPSALQEEKVTSTIETIPTAAPHRDSLSSPVCKQAPPPLPPPVPPVSLPTHTSTEPSSQFSFADLNLPDLYASFQSLCRTVRERVSSQSDIAPFTGMPSDSAPLHTPTLPPLTPNQCPPESDRSAPSNMLPADWFSTADSLKESFRVASSLDWANIDLSNHPDLLESMRQAELCDWALDPTLFTSLCDSLNRFFTKNGLIGSAPSHNPSLPPYVANPPSTPPSLASLTHPSPLTFPAPLPPAASNPLLQPPRRAQPLQRLPTTQSSHISPLPTDSAVQPQPLTPTSRPPIKHLHSNSEEIQDDFDWDSLIV